MRAVVVLCEGRHDVVFIQRSLGAGASCEWMGEPVGDLPSPFGTAPTAAKGLIAQRMQRRAIEDTALSRAAYGPPPHFEAVLKLPEADTIFVLVRTHGKDHRGAVLDLLEELDLTIGQVAPGTFDVTEYAVAFVLDANDIGVAETLAELRCRYAEHFGNLSDLRHDQWMATSRALVGCFVFHGRDGRGTLEDYLEPMANAAWPGLYDEARKFVDCNMTSEHAVWQNRARRGKAVVTVAGQFECPGEPLSAIIGRQGLPQKQFAESLLCKALTRFLTQVPWDQPSAGDGGDM